MKYPCRCSKCKGRKTLAKHPDEYKIQKHIKCSCGEYKVDSYRMKKENKNPCNCDGYHFPHKKGSLWCNYYLGQRTEEDYISRYR